MSARILLAEDDRRQAQLIRLYLEGEGHRVLVAGDGRMALEHIRTRRPDLLVLGGMTSGPDVCRVVRAESDVPILLLTPPGADEVGADDQMTRPFSLRELAARVRALLRRAGKGGSPPAAVLAVGDLEIDAARFEVRVRGRAVALTTKEFGILQALATEPGRVFTRAQIIDRAFGAARDVLERTVDAHVMNLRRKIEHDPADPRYVQTVYGRGYRLAEPEIGG